MPDIEEPPAPAAPAAPRARDDDGADPLYGSDSAGPQVAAGRALRVGALVGVLFLAASFGWDLVVAPEQIGRLWMWRAGGALLIGALGALSYAVPHRAAWLGAGIAGVGAASIGAVVSILPYGFAYGVGSFVLIAMAIGVVALDARAAATCAAGVVVGAGIALWRGGASEDAVYAIAFFLIPGLIGAVIMAHATGLRVRRNQAVRQELLALREDLARFGHNDELTGVHNERQLQQLARREIALARRRKSSLSALKIDVEKLDAINDTYGRDAGDETLRAVASMCQATLRETDLLARLEAGDEFAAVLPEADAAGAEAICDRLRKSLQKASVLAHGKLLEVTVMVGAATLSETDQVIDDLLKRAGAALAASKQPNGTA